MITEYLGRAIAKEYLDFIDNSSLKEDFQSWCFNSPYYHNKKNQSLYQTRATIKQL